MMHRLALGPRGHEVFGLVGRSGPLCHRLHPRLCHEDAQIQLMSASSDEPLSSLRSLTAHPKPTAAARDRLPRLATVVPVGASGRRRSHHLPRNASKRPRATDLHAKDVPDPPPPPLPKPAAAHPRIEHVARRREVDVRCGGRWAGGGGAEFVALVERETRERGTCNVCNACNACDVCDVCNVAANVEWETCGRGTATELGDVELAYQLG